MSALTSGQRSAGDDVGSLLARVELVVNRRLDGVLHGDYQGLIPGHGSEAGEARAYVPGDDVRRIDWTVTARTRQAHVRDTIADRELEATVVLDLSASLEFGTVQRTKRTLALEVAAAIGLLVAVGGNRVGYLVMAGDGASWLPRRAGRAGVHAAIRRSAALGGGSMALAEGLRRTANLSPRRGMVVLVSDFLDPGDWSAELRRLSVRHEVLAIELFDPRELEMPDVGLVRLVDPETGRQRDLDTSSAELRRRFDEAAQRQRRKVAEGIRRAGADHLRLSTGEDWLRGLITHLGERRRYRSRQPVRR